MREYNQHFQKLSLEKRSLEKIADVLKRMEKSKIQIERQEEIIVQIVQELLRSQIKNISP